MTWPKHGHIVVDGLDRALHMNFELRKSGTLLTSQLDCYFYLSRLGELCEIIQDNALLSIKSSD